MTTINIKSPDTIVRSKLWRKRNFVTTKNKKDLLKWGDRSFNNNVVYISDYKK